MFRQRNVLISQYIHPIFVWRVSDIEMYSINYKENQMTQIHIENEIWLHKVS